MDPAGAPKNFFPPSRPEITGQTTELTKTAEEFDKMVAMFTPTIRENFFQESHASDDVDFAPNIATNYGENKAKAASHAYMFALANVLLEYGYKSESYRAFYRIVKNYGCTRSAEKLELPELREVASLPKSSGESSSDETSLSSSDD